MGGFHFGFCTFTNRHWTCDNYSGIEGVEANQTVLLAQSTEPQAIDAIHFDSRQVFEVQCRRKEAER